MVSVKEETLNRDNLKLLSTIKISKGLIIKPKWADLILDGYKTIEIRGSRTKIRGDIGIIKSGSKKIYGKANLYDCTELSKEDFNELRDKHLVNISYDELLKIYPNPYGWFLKDAKIFKKAMPYMHKKGCVIWVNL